MPKQKCPLRGAVIYLCIFNWFSFCFAQTPQVSYEELQRKYVPQSSPEASYRLELELLSQGLYCFDLPMFDPVWRAKGNQILTNQKVPQEFYSSFETYIEGDYAVIYYPYDKSCGPVFLYRDASGWILDRTTVLNNIRYTPDNNNWFAHEGNYPYLDMLKKVFKLKRARTGDGVQVYVIAE